MILKILIHTFLQKNIEYNNKKGPMMYFLIFMKTKLIKTLFQLYPKNVANRKKILLVIADLLQCFSTAVTRNPCVPQKTLGVPPIYELWMFNIKFKLGCRQIVKNIRRGGTNYITLRNTDIVIQPDYKFTTLCQRMCCPIVMHIYSINVVDLVIQVDCLSSLVTCLHKNKNYLV